MATYKVEWTVAHYFVADVEADTLEEAQHKWVRGDFDKSVETGAEILDDVIFEEVK